MERGLELAVLLYQIYFLLQGHNYTFMVGRHGILKDRGGFCRKKIPFCSVRNTKEKRVLNQIKYLIWNNVYQYVKVDSNLQ